MQKFVLKTMKKVAAISTGVAMLGATLTGAMALDLKEYPSPFVKDGVYDDANVFVVGKDAIAADTLAALDIAANLQFESKTATSEAGSSVTVIGGKSEKVALGKGLSNTTFFDTELDDSDISSLFDGTISWGTSTYDTSEKFEMTDRNDPKLQTSLTASQDDFKSDVFLTTTKGKLVYRYRFDKTINISSASTTSPVILDFLGKKLKITAVTDLDTFSAYVGDEHYMTVGESVTVAGKTVKLTSVSTTKAVINVDGVTQSISSGDAQTVNGIQVTVDSVYSRDKLEESSASLILGTVSSKTYNDGDAYVGEDESNPDWVWTLASLTASGTSQTLGVKNDFRKTSPSDKPVGVGECYSFPNEFLSVCLDSLTIADADLAEYTFEIDTDSDLSKAVTSASSADTIWIHTSATDGLELRSFGTATNISWANTTSTVKTKEVWITTDVALTELTGVDKLPENNNATVSVFYKDTSDSKVKPYGALDSEYVSNRSAIGATLVRFNYGNTKDDNVIVKFNGGYNGTSYFNLLLDINGDATSDLDNGADDLNMSFGLTSNKLHHLGVTVNLEEAGELVWNADADTGIGSKDEDHRTKYGIIVKDPKGSSTSEKVLLLVPSDQVFGNIVIKGKASTVSSGGKAYVPTKVAVVSKTHDEVTSPTDFNLILVGGPCANPLVEDVFGLTCDGWDHAAGEAVVRLAANGEKVAMLVAGTDALDTRRAGKAVAGHADYAFEGTEVLVKGATLTDITVEAPAAAAAAE